MLATTAFHTRLSELCYYFSNIDKIVKIMNSSYFHLLNLYLLYISPQKMSNQNIGCVRIENSGNIQQRPCICLMCNVVLELVEYH